MADKNRQAARETEDNPDALHPYPESATAAAKILLDKVRGKDVPLEVASHAGWHLQGFALSRLLPDAASPPPEEPDTEGNGDYNPDESNDGPEENPDPSQAKPKSPRRLNTPSPRKAAGLKHCPDPNSIGREQVEHVLACASGERGMQGAAAGTGAGLLTGEFLSKLLSVATKLLLDWISKKTTS
jgi:hypothetical protein